MDTIKANKKQHPFSFGNIISTIIIIAIIAGGMIAGIKAYSDCLRYERVYKDSIVVQGVIASIIEEEDTEGYTFYKAYVSYSIDGTDYSEFYDSALSRRNLPSRGTVVTVKVNPEDHSELIKNITDTSFLFMFTAFAVFLLINLITDFIKDKRFLYSNDDSDKEKKDLITAVCTRTTDKTLTIIAIGAAALQLRFPFIFGIWLLIAAAAMLIFAVTRIVRNIKSLIMIKNDDFRITRSVLYDKMISNNEDSTTYYLLYRDAENTFKKSVNQKKYNEAVIGTTIKALYIGANKKPTITYDIEGISEM